MGWSVMFDPVSYALGTKAGGGGGGGDITVEELNVTENGTVTAPSGKAYTPVTVNVPNSYSASDEGKVVSNGALVAQTAHAEVTQNGTVDTTLNNSVTVNVSGSGVEKKTYTAVPATGTYALAVPVDIDTSKILFAHFYDSDAVAIYPTNGTTYEGMKLGPAGSYYQVVKDGYTWTFYRTNTSGSNGYNNYGNSSVFGNGTVTIHASPPLKAGDTIVLEVYYAV